MAAVLVATIGTRDLMFQVSSGKWYNIGDDQMRDGDIIGEQAEVIDDLNLEPINYRNLTQYLLDRVERYQERIRPVIIGKLLTEQARHIERVYLVGTNQNPPVQQREKDTIYACELLKSWLEHYYPQLAVEVISLGEDGTNPANFEQMFRWWRQTWKNKVAIQNRQPIWVCLKGGVGQSSEASRVSGLSLYGDRIQFYEFNQNLNANRAGTPSDYSGPFLGTNYLWDRKQQEILALLQHYDYEAINRRLQSAFQNADGTQPNGEQMLRVKSLVEAAVEWNQGNFEKFASKEMKVPAVPRSRQWWWTAYEAAYLAVVRYEQSNIIEAMFHSFRAVEGLMLKWAIHTFPNDVVPPKGKKTPLLRKSITDRLNLQNTDLWHEFQDRDKIPLYGNNLKQLVRLAKPNYRRCWEIKVFCKKTKHQRNQLFHRLLGLEKLDVFQAWDAQNRREWESRVLGCLNFLSEQDFTSLAKASLMSQVHKELREAITNYQP